LRNGVPAARPYRVPAPFAGYAARSAWNRSVSNPSAPCRCRLPCAPTRADKALPHLEQRASMARMRAAATIRRPGCGVCPAARSAGEAARRRRTADFDRPRSFAALRRTILAPATAIPACSSRLAISAPDARRCFLWPKAKTRQSGRYRWGAIWIPSPPNVRVYQIHDQRGKRALPRYNWMLAHSAAPAQG
jgi:hypothetical protein